MITLLPATPIQLVNVCLPLVARTYCCRHEAIPAVVWDEPAQSQASRIADMICDIAATCRISPDMVATLCTALASRCEQQASHIAQRTSSIAYRLANSEHHVLP